MSHIVGPFYYWKTVLNTFGSQALASETAPTAVTLSAELRRAMLKLKGQHMVDDGARVDYDALEQSEGFREYKLTAERLAGIDLAVMAEDERKAFFINVYNALVIHALVYGFVRKSYLGYMLSRKLLYSTAAYNIGGQVYSLDDIEHGVLRGNAQTSSGPTFAAGDPRLSCVIPKDPRIHFALNCGAVSCPPISAYKPDSLDRDLTRASKNYIQSTAFSDEGGETNIILSRLFLWYRSDFGSTDEDVLTWIRQHAPDEVAARLKAALSADQPAYRITYQEYVWTVNAV